MLFKIIVSAVCNGVYDALLEQALTCSCVQEHHSDCVRNTFEYLSNVQCCLHFCVGAFMLFCGFYFVVQGRTNREEDLGTPFYVLTAFREFVVGKITGLFVLTMLIELLGFYCSRKAQMKPDGQEALQKWDAPTKSCFGGEGPPPNKQWNKFIGPKKTFSDLPEFAPTYDRSVGICCFTFYSEKAGNPQRIPCCFRRRRRPSTASPSAAATQSDQIVKDDSARLSPVNVDKE